MAIWKDVIVGGFASGHLRVYNATSGAIGAEVTAHARAINAVDIAKDSGLVSWILLLFFCVCFLF